MLNPPSLERKYARTYLGNQESREAVALRRQIAKGAREALEEQYWRVLELTIQARPTEARLGGDPSISNKVRAFLFVRYYRNGEWDDKIEVCFTPLYVYEFTDLPVIQIIAGQPIWARLFYLVRTGHVQEALEEALHFQQAIDHREASFVNHFRTWIESPDRKYVPTYFTKIRFSISRPGYPSRTATTCRRSTTPICCIQPLRILSSWHFTNS